MKTLKLNKNIWQVFILRPKHYVTKCVIMWQLLSRTLSDLTQNNSKGQSNTFKLSTEWQTTAIKNGLAHLDHKDWQVECQIHATVMVIQANHSYCHMAGMTECRGLTLESTQTVLTLNGRLAYCYWDIISLSYCYWDTIIMSESCWAILPQTQRLSSGGVICSKQYNCSHFQSINHTVYKAQVNVLCKLH